MHLKKPLSVGCGFSEGLVKQAILMELREAAEPKPDSPYEPP
jgi:hypothetical protein